MTKTKTKKNAPKAAKKAVAKGPSRRSQQRLIALRMGLDSATINAEDLREACRKVDVYDAPNFKQDMKKESALFNPVVKDGKTVGWKLTAIGRQIAKKAPNPPTKAGAKPKADKPKADKPKASAKPKASKPKASKAVKPEAAEAEKVTADAATV